jgi:hypothetical protein
MKKTKVLAATGAPSRIVAGKEDIPSKKKGLW